MELLYEIVMEVENEQYVMGDVIRELIMGNVYGIKTYLEGVGQEGGEEMNDKVLEMFDFLDIN